ncbi:MAG: PAS domain-containing protein [Alphaproteobacteria bacterium]|nr:PAS domain-containing protein [Alphaproteobacteria bacterium]
MATAGMRGRIATGRGLFDMRSARAALLVAAAATVAVALAACALVLWQGRSATVTRAADRADSLAMALEQHATQNFQAVRLVFRLVSDNFTQRYRSGIVDPHGLHDMLRDFVRSAPQVGALMILDGEGRSIGDSGSAVPRPLDAADRDYFVVHRAGVLPDIYVSRPVRGRVVPDWRIVASQRLNDASGNMVGVVIASLNPRTIAEFYGSLDRGGGMEINLLRNDGMVLVGHPYEEGAIGHASAELGRLPWEPRASGYVKMAGERGDRHVAFRALADLPLIVAVSFDLDKVLARWRRSAVYYALTAAVVICVVVVLTAVMIAQLNRSERADRALAASEDRLADLVDSMTDWVWEQDADLRFRHMSSGCGNARVDALDTAGFLGKRREDTNILADPELLRRHLEDLQARRPFRDFRASWVLKDGTLGHFSISGKPLFDADGRFLGYRGTGRDVTAEVDASARAARNEHLLFDAIESFPEAFVLWDADDRLVVCNERYRSLMPSVDGDDWAGRTFEEMLRACVAAGLLLEAAGREESWVAERLAGHRDPGEPRETALADGRWMLLSERRTVNGTAAFYIDITNLKKAEMRAEATAAELKRSRDVLQAVLDNVPAIISVKDRDRRYVLMNRFGAETWNLPVERIIGRRLDEFQPPVMSGEAHAGVASAVHDRDLDVLRTGEAQLFYEDHWQQSDGSIRYNLTSKVPLRGTAGEVEGVLSVTMDISRQKRAETRAEAAAQELARSRDLLKAILDNMPARINVKDAERRYIHVNRAHLKTWGVAETDILGKRFEDCVIPHITPADHAERARRIAEHDRLILERERQEIFYEDVYEGASGQKHHFVTCKVPLCGADGRVDAILTVAMEITDRKRAELELVEANQRMADFAETSSDWFWETDAEHRFVLMSDGVRILGTDPRQMIGRSRMNISVDRDSDAAKWEAHVTDLRAHRPFRAFVYRAELNGRTCYIETSGKPLFDAEGRFAGYRGTGRDVTQAVELQQALIEAKDSAVVASRAKSDFLANMSHELRTPLNAVIGFAEMLATGLPGPLTAKQGEYLRDIRDSGRHLLAVINDVLDLAKIEAGRLELHEETVEVRAVVGDCVRLVRERAAMGGVELADRCGAPILLRADLMALKKILTNLLSNAVKFTPSGGRVEVDARIGADGEFAMSVADTGVGMSADEVPRALEPFGQIDGALTRRHQGTGLGLPLSVSLAERMGGSLVVDSEKGRGTTVTVRLPAERVLHAAPSTSAA